MRISKVSTTVPSEDWMVARLNFFNLGFQVCGAYAPTYSDGREAQKRLSFEEGAVSVSTGWNLEIQVRMEAPE